MLLNIDTATISAGVTQSHKYEYFVLNEMIDINTEYVLSIDKVEITNYSTSVKGVQTYFANEYIAESSKVAPHIFKVQNTPQKFTFSINRFNTTRLLVYAGEDGRTAGNTVKLTGVKLYKASEEPIQEPPSAPSTGGGKNEDIGGAKMSGEIFIADKKTLDEVKQDTQYIKNQFPVSGGTTWEDYDYMSESKKWDKVPEFREWIDVLNISGAGYIKHLTVNSGDFNSPTENCVVKLRLLKDGDTVCEVVNDKFDCEIKLRHLSEGMSYLNDKAKFYRSIDTIFFKKSLKVQVYYDNKWQSLSGNGAYLFFIGGVK